MTPAVQMLSRSAMRMPTVANQIVARRTFSSTRMQLASPYHYPEGPRSNLPFNPLTKFFAIRFWGFMGELPSRHPHAIPCANTSTATGFFLPFGVAGKQIASKTPFPILRILTIKQSGSSTRTNRRIVVHGLPTLAWLQSYSKDAGPSCRMYIIVRMNPEHVYDFVFAITTPPKVPL